MSTTRTGMVTQKQLDYILMLQGRLGISTRYVERKRRINDRGMTVADASLLIDSLRARLGDVPRHDDMHDAY